MLNRLNQSCFIGECPPLITAEETPGVCSACKTKCATCAQNDTGYCLTCSSSLYLTSDNDCVVSCKSNEAILFESGLNRCVACSPGCAKCLDGRPNVCQSCEAGLVNYKFSECLSQCPEGYLVNNKSGNCLDARTQCKYGYALNKDDQCELSVQECNPGYMLNQILNRCIPVPGFYVPFPILGLLIVLTLILVVYVKAKRSMTRLLPSVIILWSLLELPIFIA